MGKSHKITRIKFEKKKEKYNYVKNSLRVWASNVFLVTLD